MTGLTKAISTINLYFPMNNQTKLLPFLARQGDVIIERIDNLPSKLKPVKRDAGRVVLAYGETTGHSHAIADEQVSLFESETESGVTFLEVREAMAALAHDEHATINLPTGNYRVSIQKQYTPAAIVRVQD